MNMHLIEYAIRYCITRDSYAFDDGLAAASTNWDRLSHATKDDVLVAVHAKGFESRRYPPIAAAYAVRYPGSTPGNVEEQTQSQCLENWPDAVNGEYHPSCCRFPKSCSIPENVGSPA